ncbi:Thioredoxin reductase [Paraconexibacter sp. AEG42_29]|uniref:Thioredoxin reductase n=1 Tax=Paraconexibacter sp. AEG42_29 TaxID=2997339 RepID=A0AAU7AQN3_9ACTN
METDPDQTWECVIVGGGAAGLSAALVLGRARRRTLLVDAGRQSNLAAHGIGGLLGHDTRPAPDLYAAGHTELAAYPTVEVRRGEVVHGRRVPGAGFALDLADGRSVTARRVLLATGMDYRPPALAGLPPLWGRSVFHCPFCHGWEVRDQPLAVLDRGDTGAQRAVLLGAWSADVTLLTDGPPGLDDARAAQLAAAGVTVDDRHVAALRGDGDTLRAAVFADGAERPLGGLLVPVTLHQRTALAHELGAAIAPPGHLSAETVQVDALSATSVAGLHAAGDLCGQMPTVANAIAAGASAAAMIVHGLMAEAAAAAAETSPAGVG